jgi:membrane protein implicated in regulation of membrane protease activity
MTKFRSLSLGTKLVLVAGPALFLGLFFTWQTIRVDYGPAGVANVPQDGWDAWGLLIGALAISTVTLVVLRRMTEVEMSDDVPWESIVLALGVAAFAIAVLKSLTDASSTWASYVFVAAAGVMALGSYLGWAEMRTSDSPLLRREEREVSPTA